MIDFGIKLRKLRAAHEMTQKVLAQKLGVERATISSYERGALYPSVETLKEICSYFGVSSDYMIGLSGIQDINTKQLNDEQILLLNELAEQFAILNSQLPTYN